MIEFSDARKHRQLTNEQLVQLVSDGINANEVAAYCGVSVETGMAMLARGRRLWIKDAEAKPVLRLASA